MKSQGFVASKYFTTYIKVQTEPVQNTTLRIQNHLMHIRII